MIDFKALVDERFIFSVISYALAKQQTDGSPHVSMATSLATDSITSVLSGGGYKIENVQHTKSSEHKVLYVQ